MNHIKDTIIIKLAIDQEVMKVNQIVLQVDQEVVQVNQIVVQVDQGVGVVQVDQGVMQATHIVDHIVNPIVDNNVLLNF